MSFSSADRWSWTIVNRSATLGPPKRIFRKNVRAGVSLLQYVIPLSNGILAASVIGTIYKATNLESYSEGSALLFTPSFVYSTTNFEDEMAQPLLLPTRHQNGALCRRLRESALRSPSP